MLRVDDLDNHDFDPIDPWGELLSNIAWMLHSLTHSMLNATLGELFLAKPCFLISSMLRIGIKSADANRTKSRRTIRENTPKEENMPTK